MPNVSAPSASTNCLPLDATTIWSRVVQGRAKVLVKDANSQPSANAINIERTSAVPGPSREDKQNTVDPVPQQAAKGQ